MNVLNLPPDWKDYPDHDHAGDGQEEVYIVLKGGYAEAGGTSWALEPGTPARVGPTAAEDPPEPGRGDDPRLGGVPGKAYEPRRK
jgi:hypothetical protein